MKEQPLPDPDEDRYFNSFCYATKLIRKEAAQYSATKTSQEGIFVCAFFDTLNPAFVFCGRPPRTKDFFGQKRDFLLRVTEII